ncbi:hypothetical protein [Pseudoflavonifractor phocaeensis]|uniref:hypothetical protein n=1 Tax=Pseudoflavonifractor phocaeensis TaxID=1870988 RepID=UPI001956C056|nr:hypothetical protein [Pseudoflavonifractor phocaeensis]MBM6924327.1 hypothetical protein [Pseudoflavonifractor phocaeensis]
MVGILELEEGRGRPKLEERRMLGLRWAAVTVPVRVGWKEKRLLRQVRRGAAALVRAGTRRVLTAEDFPYWEVLEGAGLRPVEPETFTQTLAEPLTLAALTWRDKAPERAAVLLTAPRVTPALVQAAELLCPRVRRLAVDAGEAGEELAQWLRLEFGAGVEPPDGMCPDISLAFGPGCAGGGVTFRLYGPRPDLAGFVPVVRGARLPAGLARLPLLALLWEAGQLDTEQVTFLPPRPGQLT